MSAEQFPGALTELPLVSLSRFQNLQLFSLCRETMLRPRKRLAWAAGPDEKGPAGKRTKAKNPGEVSVKMEDSSAQKTSAPKNVGRI